MTNLTLKVIPIEERSNSGPYDSPTDAILHAEQENIRSGCADLSKKIEGAMITSVRGGLSGLYFDLSNGHELSIYPSKTSTLFSLTNQSDAHAEDQCLHISDGIQVTVIGPAEQVEFEWDSLELLNQRIGKTIQKIYLSGGDIYLHVGSEAILYISVFIDMGTGMPTLCWYDTD